MKLKSSRRSPNLIINANTALVIVSPSYPPIFANGTLGIFFSRIFYKKLIVKSTSASLPLYIILVKATSSVEGSFLFSAPKFDNNYLSSII